MNNDHATTFLGLLVASASAFSIDFGKLSAGDHGEIAKSVFVFASAALGYLTNKKEKAS